MINPDRLVKTFCDLVSIDSPSSSEEKIAIELVSRLKALGLTVIRDDYGNVIASDGRENPVIDSVVEIWKGADLQEREIWDLMGISFEGHPNMKRVLLWEGFPGQTLRKELIR